MSSWSSDCAARFRRISSIASRTWSTLMSSSSSSSDSARLCLHRISLSCSLILAASTDHLLWGFTVDLQLDVHAPMRNSPSKSHPPMNSLVGISVRALTWGIAPVWVSCAVYRAVPSVLNRCDPCAFHKSFAPSNTASRCLCWFFIRKVNI